MIIPVAAGLIVILTVRVGCVVADATIKEASERFAE